MDLTVIAAVAVNGVIGDDGDMPWHIPEDLERFREHTEGSPVILGRRTHESIVERLGGPLPDRDNIVLSRAMADPDDGNVAVARSVGEALTEASRLSRGEAFVAGGARVYEQLLPLANRMLLTRVRDTPDGDTEFPDWDTTEWELVARESIPECAFLEYERRVRFY